MQRDRSLNRHPVVMAPAGSGGTVVPLACRTFLSLCPAIQLVKFLACSSHIAANAGRDPVARRVTRYAAVSGHLYPERYPLALTSDHSQVTIF